MVSDGDNFLNLRRVNFSWSLHVRVKDVFLVQVGGNVSASMLLSVLMLGMSPRILGKARGKLSSGETL